jgi:hypothetical protein
MTLPALVWRLGHPDDPFGFVPRSLCSWSYRFDDPVKEYRTLYVAEDRLTCFLEVFQDLRPNAAAIALYSQMEDAGDGMDLHEAGILTRTHLENRGLSPAKIRPEAVRLLAVEDLRVRRDLTKNLAPTLVAQSVNYLDLGEIRSDNRALTQAISRQAYEEGYHMLMFSSKIDGRPCFVLFENRSHLQQAGEPEPLAPDLPEIQTICELFSLRYRP